MKLTISSTGGTVKYKASQAITFPEALQLLSTVILGMMQQTVEKNPDAKGELYDMLNMAASRTLEQFAPEYELRPNLTAQAILEAENRIIEEDRLDSVEPHT